VAVQRFRRFSRQLERAVANFPLSLYSSNTGAPRPSSLVNFYCGAAPVENRRTRLRCSRH